MEKKFYGIKFCFVYGEDLLDYFTCIKLEKYDVIILLKYVMDWLKENEEKFGDCYKIVLFDEHAEEVDSFYIK